MTKFNPTEEQKQNLLKLAEVLETALPTVEGYSFNFDMRVYFKDNYERQLNQPEVIQNLHKQCNSSACAMGVGVLADVGDTGYDYICDYAEHNFGTTEDTTVEGMYMFSYAWWNTDNTPEGTAARIRYILEHGLPKDWREQMDGDAPLSYK